MKILVTLLCFVLAFTSANANLTEFKFNQFSNFKYQNKNASIQHKAYSLDSEILKNMAGKNEFIITQFPVNQFENANLIVRKVRNVFDNNSKFYRGNELVSAPDLQTYQGFVEGKQNSKVLITIVNGLMFAIVECNDESAYFFPAVSNNSEYVLNYASDINVPGFINENDTQDDYIFLMELKNRISKNEKVLSKDLLELELAYEADTEIFKASGSNFEKAQSYIITLLTQVSRLYEQFIDVRIKLTWLKVWTDSPADPYNAKGDWVPLRDKALIYWSDNYSDVPRDIYHVSTSIGYGGGGFGYLDALCGNKYYGMAVTSLQGANGLPTFNFSYDVYIVAHELGHNFNAQHTHSCFWNNIPLDTCVVDNACLSQGTQAKPNPGSIMSYCGGTNNQAGLGYQVRMIFRPENIAIMRAVAEQVECLSKVEDAHLLLLSPAGQEVFTDIDTLHIRWKAYNSTGIDINYSTNAGQTWELLEQNVNPEITDYIWKIPQICSNKMLISINDSQNSALADTSLLTFTISIEDPEKLVAYYPLDGNGNDEQICHLYNANAFNNVQYTQDRFTHDNKAIQFSGANYLQADGFNSSFDELTITFWLNVSNLSGSQHLVGTNWGEGWSFSTYYWGQLGFSLYVDGKGAPDQIWGGSLDANKWYYAAFTFDGKKAKIYVDGAMRAEKVWDNPVTLNKFANTPLYIGARKDNDFFSGKLDEVKIFKKALSLEEIMSMVDVNDFEGSYSTFTIFPNPANKNLNLYFSAEQSESISFEIQNLLGESIKKISGKYYSEGHHLEIIDISDLSAGIYFCTMKAGSRIETKKIVIME
jgi:hypothetical protein